MHKVGLGIMAAAAAFSIAAFAQSGNFNASQYCKDNADFDAPHDVCVDCVVSEEKNGEPSALCVCKSFATYSPEVFHEEFKNQGECIKYYRTNYGLE